MEDKRFDLVSFIEGEIHTAEDLHELMVTMPLWYRAHGLRNNDKDKVRHAVDGEDTILKNVENYFMEGVEPFDEGDETPKRIQDHLNRVIDVIMKSTPKSATLVWDKYVGLMLHEGIAFASIDDEVVFLGYLTARHGKAEYIAIHDCGGKEREIVKNLLNKGGNEEVFKRFVANRKGLTS